MSSTLPQVVVTGSTGALGGQVASALADAGIAQRLIVRSLARAPQLHGAVARQADYSDRGAALGALEGVSTLFMVSGRESPTRRRDHATFIRAAADAGVQHVVYTSFFAAAPDAVFTHARDHDEAEHLIKESGMSWTFLRDNFYMDVLPDFIGDDGVLRGPAGDGRCSFVAREDVARVAATVVMAPSEHAGQTYELTGPQALSLEEAAATMTRVLGRSITYHAETVAEAYASRRAWPTEQWEYDAWVSTYTAIASGDLSRVSDDVERVTGRAPATFDSYLLQLRRDHGLT
ncbi:SDR family oxidoreductase [Kocuria sp.]|uniref:SDR family oxidoreductase n=1 Tax=Kocuria sp. TaxID=1871328 RepID=UPI0026DFEA46|nr:SDR family oxidoreductase [Kocuria sp.]MDO5618486.1 SDR family oxidoreductase [Kocuria sp.]